MLGEDEGSLAGDDNLHTSGEFDNFLPYELNGGNNFFDIGFELNKVTEMSERLIKKVAVNYSGQQESSKKKVKRRRMSAKPTASG